MSLPKEIDLQTGARNLGNCRLVQRARSSFHCSCFRNKKGPETDWMTASAFATEWTLLLLERRRPRREDPSNVGYKLCFSRSKLSRAPHSPIPIPSRDPTIGAARK